ncbi:alpha/beta fold hydrolase [Clostridium sp. 'White wine YQ']|uniref:alpha/beta fold hydrolase n=1 Tax=Clostridium sp. 'White wine YQ' TaxID=3027474 RepID=UPI002365AE8F|nr:alpha/beta hydrolase [Clostridium sp. 'White wine YQ']MDD7795081.1 alpha/beta hydrolase [Clostridium sp. 'White wine YQ']
MKKLINRFIKIIVTSLLLLIGFSYLTNLFISISYKDKFKDNKFLELNNYKIRYTDAGSGAPIILVHDFLGSSNDFYSIKDELAKNHRVITIDLPGFGLSSKDSKQEYTYTSFSEAIINLANALSISKFSVLGHGMGGAVAINLSLTHSDRINSLILVNPTIQAGKKQVPIPSVIKKEAYINYYVQGASFSKKFIKNSNMDMDYFREDYYFNRTIPAQTLSKLITTKNTGIPMDKIKTLPNKTLLLFSSNDNSVPASLGMDLNSIIANSKLVVFNNCGHYPFIEAKDLFLKEVNNF